jgi:hypothetical protein
MRISKTISTFGLLITLSTTALVAGTTDCTPAQSAVWTQVEQTVLNLLTSQAALSVLESAVDALDPALAGDVAATDAAIQAAIAFLESVGAIPTPALAYAETVKSQIAAKVAAKGKTL